MVVKEVGVEEFIVVKDVGGGRAEELEEEVPVKMSQVCSRAEARIEAGILAGYVTYLTRLC